MKKIIQDWLNNAFGWVARRHTLLVGVPTTIAMVSTMLLFSYSYNVEQERIQLTFETQANNFANALSENFNLYHEIVRSIDSLYAASEIVKRDEFKAYTQHHLTQYRGIQALEWIPRVSHQTRANYEQAARDDGFENFQFKQWTSAGKWSLSEEYWADEYFPVYFIQPIEGNEEALGIDLASNPTRRAALERSRDTGQPIATARIKLAQETESQVGFLLFVPIYTPNQPIDTIGERREHLHGFALGVFLFADIVIASLENLDRKNIIVQITDESAEESQRLLFVDKDTDHNGFSSVNATDLQHSVAYQIGDREWRFHFIATTQFLATQRGSESWLIGIGGICITALLALALFLMTERTQMIERLVDKRTMELAQANEALVQSNIELQQFAYIASHDLQAPLRGIAGFAQILQQDYQAKLDDEANQHIERIVGGAKRLQALITDLLTYSRVDVRSRPFVTTSMNQVFDDTVMLLSTSIEDAGTSVARDELPTVMGDCSQLSQLMHNLIDNGIKYHGNQPSYVHVSAEKHSREWIISVHDNGIGIDLKHHEHIFEIFHRLHTQQQYPGTGIGLAICRRIAQRHGGRIWVESKCGVGTTFYFTIADRSTDET